MEDRDWQILITLHNMKNMTKAAETLYISQPAFTYRLKQLEKEFQTKIVHRGKRGVEFTPQGEFLVQYAKKMLIELRKTKEQVLDMNDEIRGTLHLGVSSNYARYELPPLLKLFIEKYPRVEINLITGWSSEVLQYLNKEVVRIGIVRGDVHWQEGKLLLREEPICVAYKSKIEIEELPYIPRINYKTDISLKNVIDQWWHSQFTNPPLVTMDVDRIETCKELVLNGLGYAIFPKICLTDADGLYTVDLLHNNDNQPLRRQTWMIYRHESLEMTLNKAFVEFMTEYHQKQT